MKIRNMDFVQVSLVIMEVNVFISPLITDNRF